MTTAAAAELPRLHVVTNDAVVAGARFLPRAEAVLAEGGARLALHLRAPRANGGILYSLAATLAPAAARSGSLLLVNDRVDVACAAGAHGAHLGGRGLSVAEARSVGGGRRLVIGVSVHEGDEGAAALAESADFVLAGTIYASASHPGRRGTGPRWLGGIEGGEGRVIGIGGMTPERVGAVRGAGGHGVAAIRAIWDAERPHLAAREFIQALYETTYD